MWLIICGVILWILIVWDLFRFDPDGEGVGFALIAIFIIGLLTSLYIDSRARTVSYIEDPKELQLIENEYFRPQGNNFVIKWDEEIKIIPKSKVYTIHSDSSYFTIEYKKTIKNYSQSRQRWIPGKQKNDTIYKINKYYIYRNLNE